jgi:hypothetical protein
MAAYEPIDVDRPVMYEWDPSTEISYVGRKSNGELVFERGGVLITRDKYGAGVTCSAPRIVNRPKETHKYVLLNGAYGFASLEEAKRYRSSPDTALGKVILIDGKVVGVELKDWHAT